MIGLLFQFLVSLVLNFRCVKNILSKSKSQYLFSDFVSIGYPTHDFIVDRSRGENHNPSLCLNDGELVWFSKGAFPPKGIRLSIQFHETFKRFADMDVGDFHFTFQIS